MELMPAVVCLAKTYGIRGVAIYARLKFGLTDRISLPNIPHPIHLRKNTSDIPTFQEIFTYKEYDINLNFIPRYIIDAGANIGLASIYFANKYPEATIICVEPEKTNFAVLEKNTRDYKNINPIRNAISNQSNTRLNIVDYGEGHWAFRTVSPENSVDKNILDFAMTISISDIMKKNELQFIDILKIDIEGAEKELFERNYEDWLPRTRCLMIELHDRYTEGCSRMVFKAVSEYNFSYFQQGENLVFINGDKRIMELS